MVNFPYVCLYDKEYIRKQNRQSVFRKICYLWKYLQLNNYASFIATVLDKNRNKSLMFLHLPKLNGYNKTGEYQKAQFVQCFFTDIQTSSFQE